MDITVVDQDDRHVYQPGLLFVPFGLTHPEDIVRPRGRQLHDGIDYLKRRRRPRRPRGRQVHLGDGTVLAYDVLVVATGAVLVPEETEGLTGPGWMEKVFTFYTPEGAAALEAALATFDGGRLVVNVVDMPIKCPVAPLEFCFLADWYFRERGIRDRVELTYVTPLDGAFTKPVASAQLGGMLAEQRRRAGDGVQHRARSTAPAASWSPTTAVRSVSTWPSSSPCTAARRTWAARRASATSWASCRPTSTRSSPRRHPTCSSSATPPTCLHPRPGRSPTSRARSLVENIQRHPRRRAARRRLRRARQLLHRDRLPQGDAHRLQLRHRALAGALPDRCRAAAPEGVPAQPPRQAHVPVALLAQPAARPRHPRHRLGHADRRQDTRRATRTRKD